MVTFSHPSGLSAPDLLSLWSHGYPHDIPRASPGVTKMSSFRSIFRHQIKRDKAGARYLPNLSLAAMITLVSWSPTKFELFAQAILIWLASLAVLQATFTSVAELSRRQVSCSDWLVSRVFWSRERRWLGRAVAEASSQIWYIDSTDNFQVLPDSRLYQVLSWGLLRMRCAEHYAGITLLTHSRFSNSCTSVTQKSLATFTQLAQNSSKTRISIIASTKMRRRLLTDPNLAKIRRKVECFRTSDS